MIGIIPVSGHAYDGASSISWLPMLLITWRFRPRQ